MLKEDEKAAVTEEIHSEAERLFKIIGEAYNVLSNPSKVSIGLQPPYVNVELPSSKFRRKIPLPFLGDPVFDTLEVGRRSHLREAVWKTYITLTDILLFASSKLTRRLNPLP